MKVLFAKIWRALHLPKNFQLKIMRILQDEFLIGVTGVILNEKNEVLLFKHRYRQTQWSLPGGYLKGREHPREGLEREILEESGMVVSVDEQMKLRTDRETARIDITFMGTYRGGEFTPSTEVNKGKFFPFDKLPDIATNQLVMISQALEKKQKKEKKRNGLFRR